MPWNTPERVNFAAKWWQRIGSYLAKCIPVTRGGRREEIAEVLQRVNYLLRRGEVAVIFPEGGRSRSGRVDIENYAWGTGRIAASVPGCHVLCVYLRGRKQEAWGETPIRGERFHMELACIQPKTDFRGPRAVGTSPCRSLPSSLAWRSATSMLGNDVVDLHDPDSDAATLSARFDARVFTEGERLAIDSHADPAAHRWRHWAAKEAAYKALRRRRPSVPFSPIRFEVDLRGGDPWQGRACYRPEPGTADPTAPRFVSAFWGVTGERCT